MKKISVVSVARSDLSILLPLLKLLKASPTIQLELLISGGHLNTAQGLTKNAFIEAGFTEFREIPGILDGEDSPHSCNQAMARALPLFSSALKENRPDILVVMGDRFDMFVAALAAVPLQIPICHIHGGELTEGAMDDQFRHALTKFSHLHCVAHAEYAGRVVQMGEQPWRVKIVGAPALDQLDALDFPTRSEAFSGLGFRAEDKLLVVTYHPETLEGDWGINQVKALLKALAERPEQQLFTASNVDPGQTEIMNEIQAYVQSRPHTRLVKSLGVPGYYHVLKYAEALVGNSSSGIIESPSFALPCINIGDRQRGRIQAQNIINCTAKYPDLKDAFEQALSKKFKESLLGMTSPFYHGGASKMILDFLEKYTHTELLDKKFYNLPHRVVWQTDSKTP